MESGEVKAANTHALSIGWSRHAKALLCAQL